MRRKWSIWVCCMDNEFPKRNPTRLRDFDYSQNGAYFITICAQNMRCIFGNIVGEGSPLPQLSPFGSAVKKCIDMIPEKYLDVIVDKYVIMPNHIHLILCISKENGRGDPSPTISTVVGWLKYNCTKDINALANSNGKPVFQRSFHDHIIRNVHDYTKIWEYIDTNHLRWHDDCFYSGDLP